ncbi:TRAP transporter large permease [Aestuariicella hydrocarbonica]|uniref:TRAP transporter large permease protein n=1 Tax=Pseudomaricurvus hydrocarbonicus TaxID=1470433 RepID=A0A9E5T2X9_9GAMM|nr:TRAP transporter large permease [Aestuariicella hydrocarbonica]NHO68266.1 TRAP transporter large permease [Aestuariicella hydrocarbonica]
MELSGAVLLVSFFVLLILNIPVAICIGLATLLAMLFSIDFTAAATTMTQRMAGGMNSFALLAIPFFILSGLLMGRGGIAHRLIEFAKALIGSLPGGLALVNVISCALFGSISGSAVAATSAIGGFMVPMMNKEGYDKNFNGAITVAASTTGLLIPPSNILIVYSLASGSVSIAALFIAGYVPGLLLTLSLMAIGAIYAHRKGYPTADRLPLKEALPKLLDAIPSLLLIVIVIGGIVGGVFTATEASAIAVLYSLLLAVGFYREVKLGELPGILLKATETSAVVLLLIGTSTAMSWMLSFENIPQTISQTLLTLSENPLLILLIINLILLVVGAFMDMTPAVLIFTPIFLPVVTELGISPLHFGMMMILNLCIGLCTPPVGSVLFVGCSIAKTSMTAIIRPLLPMYLAMIATLALVTYIPALSEWLPGQFGLN